ncbi:hypothetical protein E4U53_005961 [Claviceps sorghi]|nr:hypothetical protein E4U53_005961 [Claviceps sorghi]
MNRLENNIYSSSEASQRSNSLANLRYRRPSLVDALPQVSVRISDINVGGTMDPTMCFSSIWLDWSLSHTPVDGIKDVKRPNSHKVLRKTLARFDRYISFRDYLEPCPERFRASQESDKIVCAERRAYLGTPHNAGSPRTSPTVLQASSSTGALILPSNEPNASISIILSSELSPFYLPQIVLERNIQAGSARVRAPPNVLLALHNQAQRDNSRRGHNIIAVALGINVFRRILEFNIPTFGLNRAAVLASFASEVFPPRLRNRWNSGLAAQSKISESKSLAYARCRSHHSRSWMRLIYAMTSTVQCLHTLWTCRLLQLDWATLFIRGQIKRASMQSMAFNKTVCRSHQFLFPPWKGERTYLPRGDLMGLS